MDWGIALSVGLAVVIISEVTILGAIILPKIPLEPGKTWRGTVWAVSTISLIIGSVGGYVAGQFGGRGGGSTVASGKSVISTEPVQQVPVSTQSVKVEATKPVQPDGYLANTVDIYFEHGKDSKVEAWKCKMVSYRRKGNGWETVRIPVEAKNLDEFLKVISNHLSEYQKEIPANDLANRKLRIFRDPDPGEGVYDQLRQQAKGWNVEKIIAEWRTAYPSS